MSRWFPIPVCLVARLAVTSSEQGRGFGSELLLNALERTVAAAEDVGIRAILVRAINQDAADFYEAYSFEPAAEDRLLLMAPLAAVRTVLFDA